MKVKNREGSTLVMTLIVFVVLMIFGTFILGFMVNENKISLNHQYKTQAYYIARAGAIAVEAAIINMNESELKNMNEELDKAVLHVEEIQVGEGKANVILKKDTNKLIIESTGRIGKTIEIVVKNMDIEQKQNEIINIDLAIFADYYMLFESNTQNNVVGDIGTNSSSYNSIKFTSGFNDQLTINIPIGSDPKEIIDKPSWDTKIPKINYIEKIIYPVITFPDYPINLVNKGIIKTNWDNSNPIINNSGYYEELIINSNYSTTIDASKKDITLRIKNFDVQQGSIIVKGSGKVKIFIDNYIKLKGSLNKDGDIKNVEIYYNGTSKINIDNETKIYGSLYVKQSDINITGSGAINGNLVSGGNNINVSGGSYVHNGVIYAPNAYIKFLGSGNVKGGVVGKTITLSGGASVKYDSNYANSIPIISNGSSVSNLTIFKSGYFK